MARSTVTNGGIVRDGMVLYLDASNVASYPGTGSKWFDISGYGNHFNLVNNPLFVSKSLTFNMSGSTQYATCQNNTLGNFDLGSFTVETVFQSLQTPPNNTAYAAAVIQKRNASCCITSGNSGWQFGPTMWASAMDSTGAAGGNIGGNYLQTTWVLNTMYHTCHTFKRGARAIVNNNTGQLGWEITVTEWKNGSIAPSGAGPLKFLLSGSGLITSTANCTVAKGVVGYLTGSIYMIRLHDRELLPAEITQNYIVERRKFGF